MTTIIWSMTIDWILYSRYSCFVFWILKTDALKPIGSIDRTVFSHDIIVLTLRSSHQISRPVNSLSSLLSSPSSSFLEFFDNSLQNTMCLRMSDFTYFLAHTILELVIPLANKQNNERCKPINRQNEETSSMTSTESYHCFMYRAYERVIDHRPSQLLGRSFGTVYHKPPRTLHMSSI